MCILGRDIVRLCTLVSAAAGGFLLFLSLQHFNAAPSSLELSELWFLAGLLWLGATLLVLGLFASFAVCGDRTAPLHMYNGATLALLPIELGVGALWLGRSKLLRQFAALDPTLTLSSILDCLEDHRRLVATLGMAFVALQLTALLLGACLGCCGSRGVRPRRKHPWSEFWEEGGLESARAPLLPQSAPYQRGGGAASLGYHTPPSHFASPNISPDRPTRILLYPSPGRGMPAATEPPVTHL